MTPIHILVVLVAFQATLICGENATVDSVPLKEENLEKIPEFEFSSHDHGHDSHSAQMDFLDMFFGSSMQNPSPSAMKMAGVTKSDKSPEEQLEDIKEMANEIKMAIQNEMANLLTYCLASQDKEHEKEENKLRKRRSTESPMDSTQLVMRLLKHIKSNNEYQNIAIEKMMSAQEIADKFGIEFNPDPEILSDMAVAANEQAKELADILQDSIEYSNSTIEEVSFVPLEEPTISNNEYYVYSTQPEIEQFQAVPVQPVLEVSLEQNPHAGHRHHHHNQQHHHHHQPIETQMMPPPVQQGPPVSQMPPVYGSGMPQPEQGFFPQCYPEYPAFEPVTTTTTIILPIEEPIELEPELVGEEYEETVSSKVTIDHEEPGFSTVNHVMTYTLAEKTHFKTPQVESLPQQMQYYFFL